MQYYASSLLDFFENIALFFLSLLLKDVVCTAGTLTQSAECDINSAVMLDFIPTLKMVHDELKFENAS